MLHMWHNDLQVLTWLDRLSQSCLDCLMASLMDSSSRWTAATPSEKPQADEDITLRSRVTCAMHAMRQAIWAAHHAAQACMSHEVTGEARCDHQRSTLRCRQQHHALHQPLVLSSAAGSQPSIAWQHAADRIHSVVLCVIWSPTRG